MNEEVEKLLEWLHLLHMDLEQAGIALEEIATIQKDHIEARRVIEKRYRAVYALLDSVRLDPATPEWLQKQVTARMDAIDSGKADEASKSRAAPGPQVGRTFWQLPRATGEG